MRDTARKAVTGRRRHVVWAIAVLLLLVVLGMRGLRDLRLQNTIVYDRMQVTKLARFTQQRFFERYSALTMTLAESSHVTALAKASTSQDDANVVDILTAARDIFEADLIYVMNAEGTVVACTPYDDGETLTGNNYDYRPYFQGAMAGTPMVYPALGATTGQRGVYFSAPIKFDHDLEPQGVVVVKAGVRCVDDILEEWPEPAVLVSPQGVIFAANRPEWLFKTTDPMTDDALSRLKASRQFGTAPLLPVDMPLRDEKRLANQFGYHVIEESFHLSGWHFLFLSKFDETMPLTTEQRNAVTLVIVALLTLVVFSLALTYSVSQRHKVEIELRHSHDQLEKHVAERTAELRKEVAAHCRAQDALKRSRENYEAVFNAVNDGIVLVDPFAGRIIEVNATMCEMLGCTRDEAIELRLLDFCAEFPPYTERNMRQRLLLAAKGSQQVFEWRTRDCQGNLFWANISLKLVRIEERDCVLAICRDISAGKHLEDQLNQAQKMEAIGQLAGGVAHDFNNLLGGILAYANILERELQSGTDLHEAALAIEKAAERAADLTRKLLGFARRGKHQDSLMALDETVEEAVDICRRTFEKSIHIECNHSVRHMYVRGDPAQIQQVVLNLAVNARDAMTSGGRLTVSTGPVPNLPEERVLDPAKRYALIRVSDTGDGIPNDALDHIFEPFYTTKAPGKGTGLGLAMVYGIVKNHGGHIRVQSQMGEGSVFEVFLPIEERKAEIDEIPITPDPVPGVGRLLIVDDEEILRNAASQLLRRMGYDVQSVGSGEEAVAFYEDHWRDIDLVLLDMIMPGMDGAECFQALKEINPAVRAILTTGYGLEGKAQAAIDQGMCGFVGKPFSIRTLSIAVHDALTS